MKRVFCGGCGKDCGTLPDHVVNVTCFECDVKADRERIKRAAEGRFVSGCCQGEPCNICGASAEHKVAEVIQPDDPHPVRHGLSAYVCHDCFEEIMGSAAS